MAYLPTSIVAGQTGHIAHSNEIHEMVNQTRLTSRHSIINVQKPPTAVSAVAATGDGSTDDNVALQNIFDWVNVSSSPTAYTVWFPFLSASGAIARYMTSKPLRVWTNTHIKGPATIKAHPTFDWVNHPYWEDAQFKPVGNPQPGDIGLVELWNDATVRGGTSRLYIDDMTFDCVNQPGSLGLFAKMQQPGYVRKLRINNADTGWALWGQQVDVENLEIIDCKVGLYLGADVSGLGSFGGPGDCKFMNFYTINIEQFIDAAIRMDCDGPNWFYSGHFELNPAGVPSAATGARGIDCLEGSWGLTNGWFSLPGNTNHVIVVGDKTPLPSPFRTTYQITDVRVSATNTASKLMIDDKVRGFTRLVGLNRYIDHFRTLFQNDTNTDNDASIEYLGDEGGFVRIGGLKGSTGAPAGHSGAQFSTKANGGQDERQVRHYQSDGTLRAGIHQTGNMVLGAYTNATRPAATAVEAGTMIWNTDDAAPNFSDATVWRDAAGIAT